MTEKRFEVYKVSGNFGVWEVEDTLTDTVVMDTIMHKYLADRLCEKLNELSDENEQLESDLQMSREKALYWRNKAENLFGDMKTNIELKQENEQLKEEIEKYKQSNREAIKIVERYNRLLKELGYDK